MKTRHGDYTLLNDRNPEMTTITVVFKDKKENDEDSKGEEIYCLGEILMTEDRIAIKLLKTSSKRKKEDSNT